VKNHTSHTLRTTLRTRALACILATWSAAVMAQSPPADYVVGPQDVLAVQLFDQPDLGGKYTVEADGTFSFPLIGRVTAGGLTLRNVESELKKQLAAGYFTNPQVTVAVEQYRSRRVFVMGEVRNPGPVPLTGGMTLIEALARAGSTLPSASGEIAIVRAQGTNGPTLPTADRAADILRARIRDLESGSRNQNGGVNSPGAYILQNDTTVLQALSLAGGVREDGAMNRITIVRLVNGVKSELKANLGDPVKPGDTIMIPRKYF